MTAMLVLFSLTKNCRFSQSPIRFELKSCATSSVASGLNLLQLVDVNETDWSASANESMQDTSTFRLTLQRANLVASGGASLDVHVQVVDWPEALVAAHAIPVSETMYPNQAPPGESVPRNRTYVVPVEQHGCAIGLCWYVINLIYIVLYVCIYVCICYVCMYCMLYVMCVCYLCYVCMYICMYVMHVCYLCYVCMCTVFLLLKIFEFDYIQTPMNLIKFKL